MKAALDIEPLSYHYKLTDYHVHLMAKGLAEGYV
jgi:hypothetical protein